MITITINLMALSLVISCFDYSESAANAKCIPFAHHFQICNKMPYNTTMFPNLLEHRNPEEASLEVAQFKPLVKVGCSDDLEFFLCSVYAPVCLNHGPLPPCKPLCERARSGCISIMQKFGFIWPENIRCERYPDSTPNALCIDNAETKKPEEKVRVKNKTQSSYNDYRCKTDQQKDAKHYNFMGKPGCASECDPVYFTGKEKDFARNWVLFWSVVCLISTAFTLVTFFVDMSRFRYPERPIIFLSGCYFMISIAFLCGSLSDNAIACHKTDKGVELLNQGTENAACTVDFMFIYFFLMSASIWWVILTLTWFLAAGLKWGHEAIEASAQYFHAAAWAIPAAKTIAILAMNQVDGDLLSGICFVGGKNLSALRGFLLAPLFFYLVAGSVFLLAGFVALIRIRKVLKTDHSLRTDKLTKLMVRIGIFSLLYSLPAIIVIACLFYEQSYRLVWDKSWISAWLLMSESCGGQSCYHFVGEDRPDFAVFMIKYLMLLMVGITSGFWIWSGKTIQSWKQFYYKKILNKRPPKKIIFKDVSVLTNLTGKTTI
uniref:Frizzled-2 n=1 Tax=Hydra vulgaris TaxID=6087 RepID=T2MDS5_HYDVU